MSIDDLAQWARGDWPTDGHAGRSSVVSERDLWARVSLEQGLQSPPVLRSQLVAAVAATAGTQLAVDLEVAREEPATAVLGISATASACRCGDIAIAAAAVGHVPAAATGIRRATTRLRMEAAAGTARSSAEP